LIIYFTFVSDSSYNYYVLFFRFFFSHALLLHLTLNIINTHLTCVVVQQFFILLLSLLVNVNKNISGQEVWPTKRWYVRVSQPLWLWVCECVYLCVNFDMCVLMARHFSCLKYSGSVEKSESGSIWGGNSGSSPDIGMKLHFSISFCCCCCRSRSR